MDDVVGLRIDATPRQVCERIVRFIEVDSGEPQSWRELMLIAVEAKAALDNDADQARLLGIIDRELSGSPTIHDSHLVAERIVSALESETGFPSQAGVENTERENAIEGLKLVLRITRDRTMTMSVRCTEAGVAAKRVLDQLEDEDH